MRRSISRLAAAALVAAFAVGSLADSSGASHEVDCTNDPVPGSTIVGGSPTTTPVQTSYAVQAGTAQGAGVQASAHVPGVGTLYVEVDTDEIGVQFTEENGTVLFVLGADITAGNSVAGEFDVAVCVIVPGFDQIVYIDVQDLDPKPGATVSLTGCDYSSHSCAPLLRRTGVELSTPNVPASCIWLDGVQRNASASNCV